MWVQINLCKSLEGKHKNQTIKFKFMQIWSCWNGDGLKNVRKQNDACSSHPLYEIYLFRAFVCTNISLAIYDLCNDNRKELNSTLRCNDERAREKIELNDIRWRKRSSIRFSGQTEFLISLNEISIFHPPSRFDNSVLTIICRRHRVD